jgi:hypothetical protein
MSLIPLIISTCCHYACHPHTFLNFTARRSHLRSAVDVGSNAMKELSYLEYLGFDQWDVEVIIIVSQWASIKLDQHPEQREQASTRFAEFSKITDAKMSFLFDKAASRADEFPPSLPEHPIPVDITVNEKWIPSAIFEEQLSRVEKSYLGKYSKILLDTARAHYLKHHCGYNRVQLIHYTTLSSERNLLIATL